MYSHSIYVQSEVRILNTGVLISKYKRPNRVTWELRGIGPAGLKLSILTLWKCWGDNSSQVVIYQCIWKKRIQISVRKLKQVNFTFKWKLETLHGCLRA